jgi:hypothetical protein
MASVRSGLTVTGLCHRWCHAFVLFLSLETRKYSNKVADHTLKLLIIRFACSLKYFDFLYCY